MPVLMKRQRQIDETEDTCVPVAVMLLAFICSVLLSFLAGDAAASAAELIQNDITYKVVKGDCGDTIAGKMGLNWRHIAKENSLEPDSMLAVGQVLKIRFVRIVPDERLDNGIVINIPDRTLYRFENGRLKDYYFIAAGKPTWQTPTGEFTVKAKAKQPVWSVPVSIQREMEAEGKEVVDKVMPGPENPLGSHWIQLSLKGIGLHGTNAPQSIYRFASHGCMRLMPEVAEFLYKDVTVGTKGVVIYKPVKLLKTPKGRVLMEVYRDFYKNGINHSEEIKRLLSGMNAMNVVDWNKINEALARKDGLVVDISR